MKYNITIEHPHLYINVFWWYHYNHYFTFSIYTMMCVLVDVYFYICVTESATFAYRTRVYYIRCIQIIEHFLYIINTPPRWKDELFCSLNIGTYKKYIKKMGRQKIFHRYQLIWLCQILTD